MFSFRVRARARFTVLLVQIIHFDLIHCPSTNTETKTLLKKISYISLGLLSKQLRMYFRYMNMKMLPCLWKSKSYTSPWCYSKAGTVLFLEKHFR